MTRSKPRYPKAPAKPKLQGHRSGNLIVLNAGAFTPVGHKAGTPLPPRGFGAPRFTEADQASNPDKPMTRLVKDVLRAPEKLAIDIDPQTGRPIFWPVDGATLNDLERSFKAASSRGVAFNLTLSHGNTKTGIVPTDELVAPIDDVIVEDGVLWIAVYVTPDQAKFLQNPAMKVSVGVWRDWTDGLGNRYKQALIHVAVTDHPVLPGQGPFLKLANEQKGRTMDFPRLLELINSMLPGNLSLPEDTTEENLVERLDLVIMTLAGGSTEPTAPEGDGSGSTTDSTEEDAAAASLAANPMAALKGVKDAGLVGVLTQLANGMKSLTNEINSLKREKADTAKAAFVDRVKTLCAAGLNAAEGQKLITLGAKFGYDLDLLSGVESVRKTVPQRGIARTLANSQVPDLKTHSESNGEATDDEIKARLKARGIDPEKFFPRVAKR